MDSAEIFKRTLGLAWMQTGLQDWEDHHIMGCETTSDACSGGLSWFYGIFMQQNISCHWCCICHDFLYSIGGNEAARKRADALLRDCAATAGKFEGWRAPLRKIWRWFRAQVMYAAVRIAGKSHWCTS